MSRGVIFKKGETINLVVPDTACLETMISWTEMINDQDVTRYIGQGIFPQSVNAQRSYVSDILDSRSRLCLVIKANESDKFLGVISLSDIDLINRRAQLSTVCPYKCETARYAALQARALLSDHAFRKMGLSSVYSYQAYPENKRWAQASEAIGYLPSGFSLYSYAYDGSLTHRLIISLSRQQYFDLSREHDSLWPSSKVIAERLSKLNGRISKAEELFSLVSKQSQNSSWEA